jgi:hypothetical protein
MNAILFRIATVLTALFAVSCVNKITNQDPRFLRIFNREIITTYPLYLYKTGPYNPDGDKYYHNLRNAKCGFSLEDSGELCILPPGQIVIFNHLKVSIGYMTDEEKLIGVIKYRGGYLPVSYHLGSTSTDDWRIIYKDFQVPPP